MKTINVGEVAVFDHVEPNKEQALKPLEEAAEVFGAWQEWNETKNMADITRVIEEIADTIQACVNLASAMGVGDLSYAMENCKKRNIERGRITKENQEALDADGVPIHVGDTVYHINDGAELNVLSVRYTENGCLIDVKMPTARFKLAYYAMSLSHQKPDSWEQIEADEKKDIAEYWGCKGKDEKPCYECEHGLLESGKSCTTNKYKDLFRRAKALAGVDDE